MDFDVVQEFKLKCHNCHFRETTSTKEGAVNLASSHIVSDWRSDTYEHTVKITEVLLVSKKEEV